MHVTARRPPNYLPNRPAAPYCVRFFDPTLQPLHAIFLLLAAIVAGALNAVAGGGSFISFPVLLFTGVPPVQANATNTVALWTGLVTSSRAYFHRLDVPRRLLVPLLLSSIMGGLIGGLLLVKTPQRTFLHLIPWLLLAATVLFVFGPRLRAVAVKSATEGLAHTSWRVLTLVAIFELLVGIYGGYFGAGIGFMMLAMFAILGMRDIHSMNALRTLLATVVNAAAVVTFIMSRAVFWRQCLVMIAGALLGGWLGAHVAQKADPRKVRAFVIVLGFAMSAYFFVDVYR
jgi:uncharacterized membrane protein YfcA